MVATLIVWLAVKKSGAQRGGYDFYWNNIKRFASNTCSFNVKYILVVCDALKQGPDIR